MGGRRSRGRAHEELHCLPGRRRCVPAWPWPGLVSQPLLCAQQSCHGAAGQTLLVDVLLSMRRTLSVQHHLRVSGENVARRFACSHLQRAMSLVAGPPDRRSMQCTSATASGDSEACWAAGIGARVHRLCCHVLLLLKLSAAPLTEHVGEAGIRSPPGLNRTREREGNKEPPPTTATARMQAF